MDGGSNENEQHHAYQRKVAIGRHGKISFEEAEMDLAFLRFANNAVKLNKEEVLGRGSADRKFWQHKRKPSKGLLRLCSVITSLPLPNCSNK